MSFVGALFKKPKTPQSPIELNLDPDAPRNLLLGKTATGGTQLWQGLSDVDSNDNRDLNRVIVLAGHKCHRLTRIWAGSQLVYSGSLQHGVRTPMMAPRSDKGFTLVWVTYYDGRPGQTADPYLTGQATWTPDPYMTTGVTRPIRWTSTDTVSGCAYVIITMRREREKLASPLDFVFEVEGAALYDRRKDSTAGGSGTHRLTQPSTWAYSDNPAVAADHYQLGMVGGENANHIIFGMGVNPIRLPYDEFQANADLCDEMVDGIRRYAVNGELKADADHSDNITEIAKAMAARPYDVGGRVIIRPVQARPIKLTLTDDDLVSPSTYRLTDSPGGEEITNTIRGQYRDPKGRYANVSYPDVTDEDLVLDDGREFEDTLDLPLETNSARAQRLATIELEIQKRRDTLSETFMPIANILEVGDWIERVSTLRGAVTKTYEVTGLHRNEDMTVDIEARETDPSVTAWSPDQARPVNLPESLDPIILDRPDPPTITIVPGSEDGGGATRPTGSIAVPDRSTIGVTVDHYEVQYGISNGLSGDDLGISAGREKSLIIPGDHEGPYELTGLLPDTDYAWRIRALHGSVFSDWSDYATFTTPAELTVPTSRTTETVGDRTATQVLADIDAANQGVDNLTDTYGSTASAAQSAAAAAASANASEAARDTAQDAQGLAETARDAAQNARTASEAAQGLAETARDAANTAAASATSSATLSADARDQAFNNTVSDFPRSFINGTSEWTSSAQPLTDPADCTDLSSDWILNGSGNLEMVSGNRVSVHSKFKGPLIVGQRYRAFARARVIQNSTNATEGIVHIGTVNYDSAGVYQTAPAIASIRAEVSDGWQDVSYTFVEDGVYPIKVLRLMTNFGPSPDANALWEVEDLFIDDITEQYEAEQSAAASAASASAASASETSAGQSAAAATTARTGAETAQAGAETAESNAATSETNAAGSAASAASSASTATSARDTATGAATTATTQAGIATSQASAAGVSASNAQTSEINAEASRDGAFDAFAGQWPNGFENGLSEWSGSAASLSSPSDTPDATANFTVNAAGNIETAQTPTFRILYTKHKGRLTPGRRYRLRLKARVIQDTTNGSDAFAVCQVTYINADGSLVYMTAVNTGTTIQADGWVEDDAVFTALDYPRALVRIYVNYRNPANGPHADAHWEFEDAGIEDVELSEQAESSASASAASAASAAASETAAGQSAAASASSETAAETARAGAEAAESNAATSETNASGSAASAASSASTATSARDTATGAATTATTQAGIATSQATAAGVSATNAAASVVSAEASLDGALSAVRQGTFPSTFENPNDFFSFSHGGAIDALPDVLAASQHSAVNDPTEGPGIETDAQASIVPKGQYPYIPGNTYRARIRIILTDPGTQGLSYLQFRSYDGSATGQISSAFAQTLFTPTVTINEYEATYTATQAGFDAGARWLRLSALLNFGNPVQGDRTYQTYVLEFRDITSETQAATSASASAASAASAAASETASAQSAAASETSRVAADTAASNAAVSQGAAATSETNAAGSASAAAADQALTATAVRDAFNTAVSGFPNGFENGAREWMPSDVFYATPADAPDLGTSNWIINADGNLEQVNRTFLFVSSKHRARLIPNRWYRLSAKVRVIDDAAVNAGNTGFWLAGRYFNEDGSSAAFGSSNATGPLTVADGWVEIEREFQAADHHSYIIRTYVNFGSGSTHSDAQWEIEYIRIDDIEESQNASDSATAAATSASSAAASETAAGGFATTATTQANTATTAATNAGVSETNAAASATAADGSASSAAASAQQSVNASAGRNLLPNSTFLDDVEGWGFWYTSGANMADFDVSTVDDGSFNLPGEKSLRVHQINANNSGGDIDSLSPHFAVEPNKDYIVSALIGAIRCGGSVQIRWTDASYTYVAESSGSPVAGATHTFTESDPDGGPTLADFTPCWSAGTAPAGARFGQIRVRRQETASGSDSTLYVARPMAAEGNVSATAPGPWSEGRTEAELTSTREALATLSGAAVRSVDEGTVPGSGFKIVRFAGEDGSIIYQDADRQISAVRQEVIQEISADWISQYAVQRSITPGEPGMTCRGHKWGRDGDLIDWTGPFKDLPSQCHVGNAVRCTAMVSGVVQSFLYGQQESAGSKSNEDTGTTVATLSNQASNGNDVEVDASVRIWDYELVTSTSSSPPWGFSPDPTVRIKLERQIDGSGWVEVTHPPAVTGDYSSTTTYLGFDPEFGDLYQHVRQFEAIASVEHTQTGSGNASTTYGWQATMTESSPSFGTGQKTTSVSFLEN